MDKYKLDLNENKSIIVNRGSKFKEIIAENFKDKELNIAVCKLDNKYYELGEEILSGGKLELVPFTSGDGMKIYARTLQFIFIKATIDLFNDAKIVIQHSIGKGIFGEIHKSVPLNKEDLENIKKNYYKKNVGAVVLLSDGICNKSHLPEQNIESFPFPIYTVTLGDTISYPDFYIKDVFYNKTSPSNTIMPIRVVANANNCRNKKMIIKVLVNNEIIEESEIMVNSNRFSKTFATL